MVSFFTKACCGSDDVIDNLKYISKNEELINEEFRNKEYYICDNNINYSHRNINGQTLVIFSDEQSQKSDEQSQNHDKKETIPKCLNPPLGFTR